MTTTMIPFRSSNSKAASLLMGSRRVARSRSTQQLLHPSLSLTTLTRISYSTITRAAASSSTMVVWDRSRNNNNNDGSIGNFHCPTAVAVWPAGSTHITTATATSISSIRTYTSTSPTLDGNDDAAASTDDGDHQNKKMPHHQHNMFCRQCEQTADNHACVSIGMCGKTSETAALQDVLMHLIRSLSVACVTARRQGLSNDEDLRAANIFTLSATFSTLTNVNFSDERIVEYIMEGQKIKDELVAKLKNTNGNNNVVPDSALLNLNNMSIDELEEYGHSVSIPIRQHQMNNDDAFALTEMATYGLKGCCAYAMHAHQLGYDDAEVMEAIHEIFAITDDLTSSPDTDKLLKDAVLRVGEINAKVLSMLDQAHAETFGSPSPSPVRTTAVEGKCILVSGHDLKDLYELLKQTEGTGINVYTHGEMLPAHGYPKLREFSHLVGNYGTAWQNQKFEFAGFPGPVVVTTNCIIPNPRRQYKSRLYTMNEVGVDGVQHVVDRNYQQVIEQAKQCKGFPRTIEPADYITTGYNHRSVVPMADQILRAIQKGKLSRIFLIGGCDGSAWDRTYFTDLAEETPDDSLILTMGCAKNRVIHSEKLEHAMLGDTGIPRVLDMGQCNDSYSAVVVATELAKALDCSINDLPLSFAVSHLEQKAAAVLLTLLHLGVKNIRLGPTLPAYITPNVMNILQREYNLMGTNESDVKSDLAAMMDNS